MTRVRDLQTLYDYGYWANHRIFDVIARLTPEEFTREVAGSYGSVRNTMVHMMSAEWGWLDRCGGPSRGPALVAADYPAAASVIDRWREVETGARTFLAALKDEDLDQLREFSLGGTAYSMRRG
ncbi:MAG TPA: DinB family protein, partial [Bryobacteraceae bacterium]|nr:DinB family protein [Bryobacteraceae bacterium]